MDWYVINYLYPRAFEKFSNSMFPNIGLLSLSTLQFYDSKKLYQFFDREGIYLTIEMYNPTLWVSTISLENGVVLGQTQCSKTSRDECEFEGFVECFKILERIIRERM